MLTAAIFDDPRQNDRQQKMARTAVLLVLGLGATFTTLVASADILVMRDGSQVETDGGWQIDGRQVRFHATNGTLSAVRLSEVDLEASERVTMESTAEAVEAAEVAMARAPLPEPVWVLTDDDIPNVDADAFEDGAQAVAEGSVLVADSSYSKTDQREYTISGTVINSAAVAIAGLSVGVTASVIDAEGKSHALTRNAVVEDTQLDAGGSTTFRYVLGDSDIDAAGGDAGLWANAEIDFAIEFDAQETPADVDDFTIGDEIEFDDDASDDDGADDEEDADFADQP